MVNKPSGFVSGTDLVHADHKYRKNEVAPSISVSTNFKLPLGASLAEYDTFNPTLHWYSRWTQDVSTRVEKVLGKILGGNVMTYSSGLAATFSALMLLKPRRVAITGGYMGVIGAVKQFTSIHGSGIIGIDDEFQEGDICLIESPMNPTGESRNIQYYADKIHAVGGKLIVDSTFGPPPLQDPFKWGADIVMHSASKYFAGHSDMLAGVLVVKTMEEWKQLFHIRTHCGDVMGNLETATAIAQWLSLASGGYSHDGIPAGVIAVVYHSSLQKPDAQGFTPEKQMDGGYNATFGIIMATLDYARALPHTLNFFVPATSLGGVESLIEHRMGSDPDTDHRLVRLSIGMEEVEDLKDDLRAGLQSLITRNTSTTMQFPSSKL